MFSVEDPDPITAAGLKIPVAPEGRPLTLKFTVPEKPPWPVMLTVYWMLAPGCTD